MTHQNLKQLSTVLYVAGPDMRRMRAELASVLRFAREDLGHEFLDSDALGTALTAIRTESTYDDDHLRLVEDHPDRPGDQVWVYFDELNKEGFNEVGEPLGQRTGLSAAMKCITGQDTDDRDLVVARADRLLDHDGGIEWIRELSGNYSTSLHFSDQDVTVHSGASVGGPLMRAIVCLADASDSTAGNVAEELKSRGGRPPLGYTSKDGELVPKDDYNRICSVLQNVRYGHTSKNKAAEKIGCTRQTVDSALDKPYLYALEG